MTDTPIFIEKREQSDQIRAIETALLCGILTAGISFSIFSVVGAGREQQFMVLAFSETAILILSIVNLLLSPQRNLGVFPPAAVFIIFFAVIKKCCGILPFVSLVVRPAASQKGNNESPAVFFLCTDITVARVSCVSGFS